MNKSSTKPLTEPKKSFQRFLVLWSGQFISSIGSGLTSFGLGVYVFQQTGLASSTATILLLAFLPNLLLTPLAGVLADRYDRRLLMVYGDGLSALGLLFILFSLLRGDPAFWHICIGVTISSVFTALLEPSYRATITDLLSEEQYTRASGLVQVAGSARYLISPIIAGYLLLVSDIKLLLVIDICTIFITILSTLSVRQGLTPVEKVSKDDFWKEFGQGWSSLVLNKGVFMLTLMGSVLTFCLGFIQTLTTPMILAFSNSATLGVCTTVSATGLLVGSIVVGVLSIKNHFSRILSMALFFTGIFMIGFGFWENPIWIGSFGFLFFFTLPFANTCIDYLIRTNVDNVVQGRIWGLIGILSQLGYVAAYAVSGVLADHLFTPLLTKGDALADALGSILGHGPGRGYSLLIMFAGLLLSVTAIGLYQIKAIRDLEPKGELHVSETPLQ